MHRLMRHPATPIIGVLLVIVGLLSVTARATATGDHHDKPWVCHPVNGKGQTGTGWNLIKPAQASSHIDEETGAGKHVTKDGRTDVYADGQTCPGTEEPAPTPTPTPTVEPTPTEPPVTEEPTPTPTPSTPASTPPVSTPSASTPPAVTPPTHTTVPPADVETRTRYREACTSTTVIHQHRALGGAWITDNRQVRDHADTCGTTRSGAGVPVVTEEGF